MQAMLCVLRRPGVDFPEMVGRLAGEAVGAFGALNLYLQKSAQFQSVPARVGAGAGGISSTCIEAAIDDDARLRTPPDAGMKAMKQAEKPEDQNGFANLSRDVLPMLLNT